MINSHFIPQLILRHFCEEEKLTYYDIEKNRSEIRSTRSVFSEKGYYPEQLEKDLCQKIEVQFANLLNNKILSDRYKVVINEKDQLILKKFLIITCLRVHDNNMQQNAWYQVLKRDGIIPAGEEYRDFFSGDFFGNMNKVLECQDIESLITTAESSGNLNLMTYIRDIIYSYNVFVKSNNSKEEFIIPDRGWAGYRGPMSVKKLNAMMNMLQIRFDPLVDMLLHMSSPQDYAVFPITKNMAIITMSPAFKICLPGAPYNIIYPDNAPSLSACIGFGTSNTIMDPTKHILRNGTAEYKYEIQQLNKNDVCFLNSLLINNAEKFFAFSSENNVRFSLENNKIISRR